MLLPGGTVTGAVGARTVRLVPPTGWLERMLDSVDPAALPERVTGLLAAAVVTDHGAPVDADWCRRLSSGDRRFLLRQVLVSMGRGTVWRTVTCSECAAAFDVLIDHDVLRPPPVGEGWPERAISASKGPLRIRAVSGEDEEAVARLDPRAATLALLQRCVVDRRSSVPDEDRALVDSALEELGPDPVLEVGTSCPECGAEATAPVDPYLSIGAGESDLLGEIHALASSYHWSETEILDLPTERRRAYLRLVDSSRGVVS